MLFILEPSKVALSLSLYYQEVILLLAEGKSMVQSLELAYSRLRGSG